MMRHNQLILALLTAVLLPACGGNDKAANSPIEPVEKASPQANNPLKDQQQLIKDAAQVQEILDKNEVLKKKAIEGSN